MNENILMIMLVAIMVFFFIFGMVGYNKNKKNIDSELENADSSDAVKNTLEKTE